jgi:hypothetical protein
MKSLLLFLFVSFSAVGQNPNTLLLKKDSTKIDLHLPKIEKLNTTSHLLFASGVVSTMIIYNLNQKSPIMFGVPLGLCLGGMSTHIYMSHIESKYKSNQ